MSGVWDAEDEAADAASDAQSARTGDLVTPRKGPGPGSNAASKFRRMENGGDNSDSGGDGGGSGSSAEWGTTTSPRREAKGKSEQRAWWKDQSQGQGESMCAEVIHKAKQIWYGPMPWMPEVLPWRCVRREQRVVPRGQEGDRPHTHYSLESGQKGIGFSTSK